MNEKRYSVWGTQPTAIRNGAEHGTWAEAKDLRHQRTERMRIQGMDDASDRAYWRIWDHSTTPPTDVTNADPGEVAPAPIIPASVDRIEIQRDHYHEGPSHWYVKVKAGVWSASYRIDEANLFTSMADLSAHMEKHK